MGIIRENVKRNLGYYLTLRAMSQKELADRLGVSQPAVTNWIKGKNAPDIEVVAQICEILDITITELFGTENGDSYSEQERELIRCYRNHPDLHAAIHILLGMDENNY